MRDPGFDRSGVAQHGSGGILLSAGKPWQRLIEHLKQPPYGMYNSLLYIFSAAFLSHHADLVEISVAGSVGRPLAIDATLLGNLIEKSSDYSVKLQPLGERERQWLHGIITTVLQRPAEQGGGRGTALSTRVAEQVRQWLKRQRLPTLVEKLTAEQLAQFALDAEEPSRAAALLLVSRAEQGDMATALLSDIPAALGAPPDHTRWTVEDVELLHSRLTDTRRVIEQLPAALEEYATRRVARVFGCDELEPELRWNYIYQWRRLRDIVAPDRLKSSSRDLFRLANISSQTIKGAFLEEFARNTIGINVEYIRWSSLETLDRLEQAVQRAFGEINTRWSELASKEQVWYNGLSTAAQGRPAAENSAERAARHLATWSESMRWPACAPNLRAADITRLYPELLPDQCEDIVQILRRTAASQDEWRADLAQALAMQFGANDWSLKSVNQAIERFASALRRAAELDDRLRRYTLGHLAGLFGGVAGATIEQATATWRAAHPIPPQNDLTEGAQTLLAQIGDGGVIESALLTGLPRALSEIGQSYQQWGGPAQLDRYLSLVGGLIDEINSYVPLSEREYTWLAGIVTEGLGLALTTTAREQRRLAKDVLHALLSWREARRLPAFCARLRVEELAELHPSATPAQVELLRILLAATSADDPSTLLLGQIPAVLDAERAVAEWDEEQIAAAHTELRAVTRLLERLPATLTAALYHDIGAVFGVTSNGGGSGPLLAAIRRWRDSHVLMDGEPIPASARTLYTAIGNADDADTLLLRTLPARLAEPRAAYEQWTDWGERERYQVALIDAARVIEDRGRVHDATPHAQEVWAQLRQQIDGLTPDEKRWLIKQFREVFPA